MEDTLHQVLSEHFASQSFMESLTQLLGLAVDASPSHPIVAKVESTCGLDQTNTTYRDNGVDYNTTPPGQYDPMCATWRALQISLGNSWVQGILLVATFLVPLIGTSAYAIGNFVNYVIKVFFSSGSADFVRYNEVNN